MPGEGSFRADLVEDLGAAGEALEEAGYSVLEYRFGVRGDMLHTAYARSPEEGLERAIDALSGQGYESLRVAADELVGVLQGERDPLDAFYPAVEPAVEVDEPVVDLNPGGEELLRPAFGLTVEYHWQPDERYFRTDAQEVLSPYTAEGAREHIRDITAALDDAGIPAHEGDVLGQSRGTSEATEKTAADLIDELSD